MQRCGRRSVTPLHAAFSNRPPMAAVILERNTTARPFSFFQKSNLILLFARRSSSLLFYCYPPSISFFPFFFPFSFFFFFFFSCFFFYPHCFPRSIICVKKIGCAISETLGLPSQAQVYRGSTGDLIESEVRVLSVARNRESLYYTRAMKINNYAR